MHGPPGVFTNFFVSDVAPEAWCQPETWSAEEVTGSPSESASRRRSGRRARGSNRASPWGPQTEQPVAEDGEEARTTLLLKNIPESCNTALLVELLNARGFQCQYNFAYAPTNFRTQGSFGYGFVNLVSHAAALDMMEKMNGFVGWAELDIAPMEVCWSEPHQGLDLQIKRFQNSPVMHESVPDEVKPMLFNDGVRQVFPQPTKRIREPRARRYNATDSF